MIEQQVVRKKLELDRKLFSLQEELESWSSRSEEGGVLEKHHTQIRALQAHLHGWHISIQNKLKSYENLAADAYLTKCANVEKLILSEHRIWDYFRSKFIQRLEESFRLYLQAADEFVWKCYRPVLQRVYPDIVSSPAKQPPLVFFNGGVSPFSLSRGKSFQPEQVAGDVLNIDPDDYTMKLPISVVGVSWNEVNHLPAVLVLGHEVGHVVENDFALGEELKLLLTSALEKREAEERTKPWSEWLSEVFADLYGCLAGGPAFAGALLDFIGNGKERICCETKIGPDWGRYPTSFLRAEIVLKALELMGFAHTHAVKEYQQLWSDYSSSMDHAFTKDVSEIVPAILQGQLKVLGNASIMEVFSFTATEQAKVDQVVKEFCDTKFDENFKIPSTDVRVLFASLRRAFETDPHKYVERDYGEAVLDHIARKVIVKGVRSDEIKLKGSSLEKKLRVYETAGVRQLESILDGMDSLDLQRH